MHLLTFVEGTRSCLLQAVLSLSLFTFLSWRNLIGRRRGPRGGCDPGGGGGGIAVAVLAIGADLCNYGRRVHLILEDIGARMLLNATVPLLTLLVLTLLLPTRVSLSSTLVDKMAGRLSFDHILDLLFGFEGEATKLVQQHTPQVSIDGQVFRETRG